MSRSSKDSKKKIEETEPGGRAQSSDSEQDNPGGRTDSFWRTWIRRITLVSVGGVGLGLSGLIALFWFYGRDLEEIDADRLQNYRPSQLTQVRAKGGELIGEIFTQRRIVVRPEDVPKHVEDAFLAAEDLDFYRHRGMDYIGMLRAFLVNLRAGEMRQGASTITQQVVKNFLLSPERTLERKVQELILARRVELHLDKREILHLYLNDIYLGHGRYGIEAASQFYFGKSVREISVAQSAILAALPKAPSKLSPIRNPEGVKARQLYVLGQMVEHGMAQPEVLASAKSGELELGQAEGVQAGAEEFVDYVSEELERRFGQEKLDRLGAVVTTTVDLDLQRATKTAALKGLQQLDRRHNYGRATKAASENSLKRALKKGEGKLRYGKRYPLIVEKRPDNPTLPEEGFVGKIGTTSVFVQVGAVGAGGRYIDPELETEQQFVPGGITFVRLLEPREMPDALQKLPEGWKAATVDAGPQVSAILAEVESGEVRALLGGWNYARGDFNRALRAKRQPGSAFKPIVYGAALATRRFTPASIVSDSPESYDKWRPSNYKRDQYRGDIRLREALTHSVNTVAVKLLDSVGISEVVAFARSLGIESELEENLSLALGTSELSPQELLKAYLCFARGGLESKLRFIHSIEIDGMLVAEDEQDHSPRRMIEAEVAYLVTSMLQSVVEEGTGQKAKALGRPAAGKTGTSNGARDTWFAGYTPTHASVVWVGFDQPRPMKRESGGRAALPIWVELMKEAEKDVEIRAFLRPPGLVARQIEAKSGLLIPTQMDTAELKRANVSSLDEFFIEGTEPVEEANLEWESAPDALLDLYGDVPLPSFE